LKFRILEVLAWAKEPMTSQDIANALGVSYGKVNCVLAQYKKKDMPYFIRLSKKTGLRGRTIRYKISKSGLIIYLKCLVRIKRGFDLNFRGKKVKRMETYGKYDHSKPKCREDYNLLPEQLIPYLGITKHGIELGLNIDDVVYIAGIVKRDDSN
jgi:hypothetical protein